MYRNLLTVALFIVANYLVAQNLQTNIRNVNNNSVSINLSYNFYETNRGRNINLVNISNQKVTNTRNFQLVQNDNVGIQTRRNFSQSNLTNLVQQSIPKQKNSNKTQVNNRNQDQLIGGIALQVQNTNPINRVQQQRNSNPFQLLNDTKEINGVEIQVQLINIQSPAINTDIQINEMKIEIDLPELPKIEIPAFTASLDLDLSLTKPEISLPELVMPKINLPKISLPEREIKEKTDRKTKHSGYSQKGRNYTGKKIRIWFQKNFKIVHKIRLSVSCPKF